MYAQDEVSDRVSPDTMGPSGRSLDTHDTGDALPHDVVKGTGEPGAKVELFLDRRDGDGLKPIDTVDVATVPDDKGNYIWTYDYSALGLADGVYDFEARQVDISGNESAHSDPFDLMIGDIVGEAPTIVTHNAGLVAGTADPGVTVRVVNETTGRVLGIAEADDKGHWQQEILAINADLQNVPHPLLGINDVVSAVVVNGAAVSPPARAAVTQELVYLHSHEGNSGSKITSYFAGDDGTFGGVAQSTDLAGSRTGIGFRQFADYADVNGDGIKDYVSGEEGVISVAYGRADGTFFDPPKPSLHIPSASGFTKELPTGESATMSSNMTDFNADGYADYILTLWSGTQTAVEAYRGRRNGLFEPKLATTMLDIPGGDDDDSFVRFVDLDGDATAELISGDRNVVSVFKGRPDGTFERTPVTSNLPTGFDHDKNTGLTDFDHDKNTVFADFDQDGLVDYLFSHQDQVTGETSLEVYRGLKLDGTFSEQPITTRLPGGDNVRSWSYGLGRVGDIDGDGKLDYVAGNDGALDVFPGRGNGTFSSAPERTLPLPARADLDDNSFLTTLFGEDRFTSLFGGSSGETLNGTDKSDRIIAHGGDDNITAGSGDDFIYVPDFGFGNVNGGEGLDTLIVTGGGGTLDLADYSRNKVHDIEFIDLSGNGGNTLKLSPEAVEASGIQRVFGGPDDHVVLEGFVKETEAVWGDEPFDVYMNATHFVSVAQDIVTDVI